MPFWTRRRNGYTFVFKSDPLDDTMAHIFARHTKTEEDAIRIWFDHSGERWNEEHQRFECFTETEGLHWVYHDKDTDGTLIMVISCFNRRDGE